MSSTATHIQELDPNTVTGAAWAVIKQRRLDHEGNALRLYDLNLERSE